MRNMKEKVIYILSLIVFLFVGIGVGYLRVRFISGIKVDNLSIIDYAKGFNIAIDRELAVTTSTKTYDVEVVYEDHYLICNETITTSSIIYGTTIDEVKIKEEENQYKTGLVYDIKSETEIKIVYRRTLNENCPNHFFVVVEDGKINIYSIVSEGVMKCIRTIDDINIEHLREDIKEKLEKGTFIHSKEELNYFIEDLES